MTCTREKILGTHKTLIAHTLITFFVIITLCGGIYLLATADDRIAAEAANIRTKKEKELAARFISNVRYIKDPRTNLCFVYYADGSGAGIALVPEESIPPKLLIVAEVE